jgi:hypothetical protein
VIAGVVSEGTSEGRDFVKGVFENGSSEFNYTQNFDEGYNISGSMLEMDTDARIADENVQAMFAIDRYLQKLSKSMVNGFRYTKTVSGKRVSGMGGLRSFVNVAGGNVLSVTGNPTKADFSSIAQKILETGGTTEGMKIYLNPKWATVVD